MRAHQGEAQRFYSLPTRLLGVVGLLLVVLFLAIGVLKEHYDPGVLALLVFAGVMIWVAMLRQTLVLTATTLHIHALFTDVVVPLKLVGEIGIAQVLAIRLEDGRRFVSGAIGRTRRQQYRDVRRQEGRRGIVGGLLSLPQATDVGGPIADVGDKPVYETLVVSQIRNARDTARREGRGPDEVVRTLAWPEIALAVGSFVATVALFVTG